MLSVEKKAVVPPKPLDHKYTALLLLSVVAAGAWLLNRYDWKWWDEVPANVDAVSAFKVDMAPEVRVQGYLQASRREVLRVETPGRIKKLYVKTGDKVSKGQELLVVEADGVRDTFEEAVTYYERELAAVERDLALLQVMKEKQSLQTREIERQQQARAAGQGSQEAEDKARQGLLQLQSEQLKLQHNVSTAKGRIESRLAALHRARLALEQGRLMAPFSGVVKRVLVRAGDYIKKPQPVIELLGSGGVEMTVEVEGDVATQLHAGQAVEVEIEGLIHRGGIVALEPLSSQKNASHRLRVRVPDPAISSKVLATVVLPLKKLPEALVVPATALITEEGRSKVYVIEDNTLVQRQVTAGPREGKWQVISGEVRAGDLLVAAGAAELKPGQLVNY